MRKPAPAKAGGAEPQPALATGVYEMENGGKITLKVRSEGDPRWAMVEATGEGDAKAAAEPSTRARPAGSSGCQLEVRADFQEAGRSR